MNQANLQDTIQALLCDKWRNDLQAEIDSIYQTLPNAYAVVHTYAGEDYDSGEKAQVVRNWIANVLRKVGHYKSQHRRC